LLGGRDNVGLVEILLIPKHNHEELENKRRHQEDKEVDGCTFRP